MHHQAAARELTLNLKTATAAVDLSEVVTTLLQSLAEDLSIKDVIPGHIKALVTENDVFANFSCTKPGKVLEKRSPTWHCASIKCPQVYINVIVFGISQEKVNTVVDNFIGELINMDFIS